MVLNLVLAKMIEVAKEIRPDDKKRGRERRSGWGLGGCFPSLDAWIPQEEGRRRAAADIRCKPGRDAGRVPAAG